MQTGNLTMDFCKCSLDKEIKFVQMKNKLQGILAENNGAIWGLLLLKYLTTLEILKHLYTKYPHYIFLKTLHTGHIGQLCSMLAMGEREQHAGQ